MTTKVKIAGWSAKHRYLSIENYLSTCGNITKGLLVSFGDDAPWVIDFEELKKAIAKVKEPK